MKIFKGIMLLTILGIILVFMNCASDDEDKTPAEAKLVQEMLKNSSEKSQDKANESRNINRTTYTIPETTHTYTTTGLIMTITFSGTFNNLTNETFFNINTTSDFSGFSICNSTLTGQIEDTMELIGTDEKVTVTITTTGSVTVVGENISGIIVFNDLKVKITAKNSENYKFEVLSGNVTVNGEEISISDLES